MTLNDASKWAAEAKLYVGTKILGSDSYIQPVVGSEVRLRNASIAPSLNQKVEFGWLATDELDLPDKHAILLSMPTSTEQIVRIRITGSFRSTPTIRGYMHA